MFINQSMQAYVRPVSPSSLWQQWRQKNLGQLGSKVLWAAVGKVLIFFCPLLIVASFYLYFSAERMATEIHLAEEDHRLMQDENIRLRVERARLYAPEHLNKIAAKQLALYVPEKGQVVKF
jgi:hypothetical protein